VLRLLIDHDFNDRILQGLQIRVPDLDAVAAGMLGFERTLDPTLLAWAAAEKRIVVTHDVQTMPGYAISRVRRGDPMPGLVIVPQQVPIGRAIEELTMLVLCSDESEWMDLIIYFSVIENVPSDWPREGKNHQTNPLANPTSGAMLPGQGMGPIPVGVSIEIRKFDFLTRPEVSFATLLPVGIHAVQVDVRLV